MVRLVSNPPNPWASSHVEWLEEPPEAQLEVPDRARQGRLRHVQRRGGAAEVQVLGHGDEMAQLA